jgi:hypothetical protein
VRLLGAVYLALGIIGFLPVDFINPLNHHPGGIGAHYLFNLIAINTLHNIVHLTIGITGLWAATTLEKAQWWGKVAGVVLLLLFAAGMAQAFSEGFPYDQLLLGLVPLNSPGHILHIISGGIALFLGLVPVPAPPQKS